MGNPFAIDENLSKPLGIGAAATLCAVVLLLVASAPGGPTTAHAAGGCANADKLPRTIGTGKAEKAVRCIINAKRKRRGLRAVRNSSDLAKAADRHSIFMRDNHCFAHQCNGEAALSRRLQRAGYLPCGCTYLYGEAISWSFGTSATARKTVKAWMKSKPHRKILLDKRFRDVGIGTVWGSPHDPKDNAAIFTADFGLKK